MRNNLVRVAVEITLDKEEQDKLEKIVRSSLSPVRLAQRAQIVLMANEGMRNQDIANALGIGRVKVSRWRNRYAQSGLAGIERDLPRGAPPQKVDIKRLVDLTTQHKPAGATHWSTRKAAAELGVHASTISRHWRRLGLKPHLEQTFKVSRDPKFVEKLEDIVGLYMSPPENALVLCCDEKSQIQALDRTQPGLPLKKGRVQTMTHDYGIAIEEGPGSDNDSRLQTQRHDHLICRPECARWHRHWTMSATSPPHRMAEISPTDRPGNTEGKDLAFNR